MADAASRIFPEWAIRGLKSRRTLKTWARSILTFVAAMILLVNQTTLTNMGQSGFFAALIAISLPPFLPLSLYINLAFTLALGMLLGWAWGTAAMASALSVRSPALLAQQQMEAQASTVDQLIFHGHFLDPRSSAVYGAFLFIGVYLFGLISANYPNMFLGTMFGTIIMASTCTMGPLFFSPQYTMASMFLLPAAYYIAIAIVSLALIFPESVNHVWLTKLGTNVLVPVQKMIGLQDRMFELDPGDLEAWSKLETSTQGVTQSLIAGIQALLRQVPFISLEISIGILGPSDLKSVSKHLDVITARTTCLAGFLRTIHADLRTKSRSGTNDRHILHRERAHEKETRHGNDIATLLPILSVASADLRAQCLDSTQVLVDWFHECNTKRWTRFLQPLNSSRVEDRHEKLTTTLANLERTLAEFCHQDRKKLLKPYERFFHPETGRLPDHLLDDPSHPDMFHAHTLFLCFTFADTLVAFSEELSSFLRTAIDLDAKRKKPRIWLPAKLTTRVRHAAQASDTQLDPMGLGYRSDPTTFEERSLSVSTNISDTTLEADHPAKKHVRKVRKYNTPDALPPKSAADHFFVYFAALLRFSRSPPSVYAFRCALISTALWVPSVCTSTAWFAYSNNSIWALIMAQQSVAVYAGDQIESFLLQVAGTALGLLLGMAAWYMGSGRGDGNPYGVVAATTAVIAPLLFVQLTSPPRYFRCWIVACVTCIFVIGFSWVDTHLPELIVVSTGVGIHMGWKRGLLVLIGFTAGFIVMLFPRPSTSRTLVRKTLAASIDEFTSILSRELEVLLLEHESHLPESDKRSIDSSMSCTVTTKSQRAAGLGLKLISASTRLTSLGPSLQTAQFEPGLQGRWPKELYHKLYANLNGLLVYMALLGTTLCRLEPEWSDRLIHQTTFLNPNLLSELFSTLSILSSSLASGHFVPCSLPSLRDRLVYHGRMSQYQLQQLGRLKTLSSDPQSLDAIDTAHLGLFDLTFETLADDQLPIHSTAVIALSSIFRIIDDCAEVIKELCGQSNLSGFDSLREEFMKREEVTACGQYAHSKQKDDIVNV